MQPEKSKSQTPKPTEIVESITQRQLEDRLAQSEPIDADVDEILHVRIDGSTPSLGVALHDGHRLRPSLSARCLLTDEERRFEEDPFTGALIRALPITAIALDSRYEYDLNRPRSQCVYTKAWGHEVWQGKLPPSEIKRSRKKHRQAYSIINSIIKELELRFGAVIIYDVHSYNHERTGDDPPTFNIGTSQIDLERWDTIIKKLERQLSRISLPNLKVRVARNEVFSGQGYLAAHVSATFHDSLVIPLEIAKIFRNSISGDHYPLLLEELRLQLKHAFVDVSRAFAKKYVRRSQRKAQFISSQLDSRVVNIDRKLHKIARGIDTLRYVNPINIAAEKKRFFARKGEEPPSFRYRYLEIDPYKFREELYHLPVRKIRDPDIQALYRDIIDRLAVRIELITTIGRESFLYNSLRYYGEPNEIDLANARFLLHAPPIPTEHDEVNISPKEAVNFFQNRATQWQLPVRVELSGRLAAKAMMQSGKKVLLVNKSTFFSQRDLEALSHHELGTHLITTLNAIAQPMKILRLGLPGNTEAQEGLAVLCEYLSGHLTLARLRTLAYRVLAVFDMTHHSDFRHTYSVLHKEYGVPDDQAFDITLRVYRGGGYTKDFLYLRGLGRAWLAYRANRLEPLLIGKVGFAHTGILTELMDRGVLKQLSFRAPAIASPVKSHPLLDYLLSGIRVASW